jgi:ABC-type protease/lipase transport system fused ATPase/permease subunit
MTFSIGPGEGTAPIGPSESGKTTLLRVLGVMLLADGAVPPKTTDDG